jgi:hypothetical protein
MNKLLQHIIDAGDVDHRVLPGLQKAKKQFNADKNPYLVFAQEGAEYKGPSIVDYLATKGYSGKKAFRKELADKYGIEGYDFSAAKNTQLLNKLRESDELLRQYDQTMAPVPVERMMEMEQQARAARQAAAQRPAPVYNYSPEFQNMRIPQTKINTSLQPKVIYDGKFSLKPQMVIPMPFGFNKTTLAPEVPTSEITDPITPARPRVTIPQFNPFVRPAVKPELGPFISNKYYDEQEVVDPVSEQEAPEFLFNSEKLFNSFNRPKQKPLLPVVPANKPVVKTQKYTTEVETEELPWYQEAANAVTNTLKGFYNDFAESVEKSPLDFKQMSLGTAMSPQGAQAMTRDFTTRGLSLFSPDMAEKYNNWLNRQQAIKNMDKDPVSKIVVPDFDYAPMYITGDTIPDSQRQYHLPESMDLNALKFGSRNRGDLTPIDTEAASITAFHPFVDSKSYFTETPNDPANSTYLGITPDGQIQVGGRKDFENKDVKISRVFSNKVVDFVKDQSGSIKKVPAGAKVNKNAFSPAVTVIDDSGKQVEGKLNLVVPQGNNADEAFGVATGGRFIFKTPDGQTRLVSGSLKNIEEEFKRIKGKNPYVTVVSLDNGSYSRGLRTKDQKLTAQDLRSYDNLNHGGGGNFAYLLPGQQTSRPLAKFAEFEKEATRRLQALYPGKKVSVGYQNTGLYDQTGGRDIQSQLAIQKQGNSQTPVSLHNFGAAKDYVLYVDGKPVNADKDKKVYKDVLWNAADKVGMYHLEDWDPAHISLAKEGQKTAFDELKSKYPEIFNDPNFVKSLEFINKNKNNPAYQEYYELLNNIQPFTGAPRTTDFMKRSSSTAKKAYGGPVDLPKAQWGQLVNPITMGAFATMAVKLRDFLGLDEPKIVRTPASAPKRLSIRDPRKVMMTSGKPLRPNSDLVSGDYDSEHLGNLMTEAKRRKMSYNDMMNLAAMGFQETKWGQTDPNIGHTQDIFSDDPNPDAYENFIDAYNAKMKDADRLKIKDEATRLQVYNGLGKVFPSTEADYHGFKMKKIYGVDVPKGGIDLRKNPLYGKQVIDIRDNVLKRNPEFMRYMDSTYRAPRPMPKEEDFANGGVFNLAKMQMAGKVSAKKVNTSVNSITNTLLDYEKSLDHWLGRPMDKAVKAGISASKQYFGPKDDPLDNFRHPMAGRYTSEAIQDKFGNIPILSQAAGFLGANVLGAGHELSTLMKRNDDRAWGVKIRESAEDAFNNMVGAAVGSTPFISPEQKTKYLLNLSLNNKLPDGYGQGNMYIKKQGGPILDTRGQWAHPGKVTRIPSANITMQGVPYPVYGVGSNGQQQMMYPGQEYNFGGASYVDEYPMMRNGGGLLSKTVSCSNCGWSWKAVEGGYDPLTCHKCGGMVKMKNGGQHGGLDRWFAEKWVDVKSGKACGRQEGENRAYPACRPSKRVSSETPKTASEMSSAEKAKFKTNKTSSQRINYNHKRNK